MIPSSVPLSNAVLGRKVVEGGEGGDVIRVGKKPSAKGGTFVLKVPSEYFGQFRLFNLTP
jgi:hypothetical protein